jgi:CBS domain-containing protein
MLRHLGAAYYDSLHGRAAPGDVARALDSVAQQFGEPAHGTVAAPAAGHHSGGRRQHHGRWHSRVCDVMTTPVVTVDRITPYKEIARLLAEHKVSGVPVLVLGRHVAGVVSEGDLIAARDAHAPVRRSRLPWAARRPQHLGLTAADLMTSPAVTIHPDATISAAARMMAAHHLRRLPVVASDGTLIGIVSRRDLLRLYLREDAHIARQVDEMLTEILPGGPAGIHVGVQDGVVTLTGQPELASEQDLLPVAVRLAWDIDGVVDVIDKVGEAVASAAHRS